MVSMMSNDNNTSLSFTVARHPDAKSKTSVFKWVVLRDGQVFEGFRTRDAAQDAADKYNTEAGAR